MSSQKLTSNNSLTNGVQLVKERNRSSNKVKLCGYLKKKRNKVGGWRKMWFVLQDKLLLSYTSKEEYDNKLVSFKDVLNLVPGTTVRPLGGFRFTIETATHVMYTFHCDDRNAYREWITTLLDSLCATKYISATCSTSSPSFSASTLATYSLLPMQHSRFRNTSVDNIPHALYSNVADNSQRQRELSSSCDSMRQRIELVDGNYEYAYLERIAHNAKTATTNGLTSKPRLPLTPTLSLPTHGYNSVSSSRSSDGSCGGNGESGAGAVARLPIARSTAKILERNGVNSSGLTKKHQQQQYQKRQQQQQQQVNCCNRNNGTIMNAATDGKSNGNVFDEHFITEASATHFRLHGESTTNNCMDEEANGHSSASAGTGSSTISSAGSASVARYPINQSVLRINSMFQQKQQQQSISSTPSSEGASSTCYHQVLTHKDLLPYPKSTKTNCDQIEFIPKHKHSYKKTNDINTDHQSSLLVNCCTISGDGQVVDDNISADYSCCTNDSKAMVIVKDQIQRMNIKGRKETNSYANAVDPVDKRERRRINVTKRSEEETLTESVNMSKPVVGGVVAKSKSLDNDGITKSTNARHCDVIEGDANTKSNRSSEPIYAVVDLAHKYAQRQQRIDKNYLKSLDVSRCRSYESIIQGVEPRIVAPTSRDSSIEKSTSNLHEDDIDGIYEDGDKFVTNCANNEIITNSEEDENIYEPVGFHNFSSQKINAPTTQPNTFWRYITRLKVNSLLQFTRMRRGNHVDYDSLHLPNTPSSPAPTLKTKHKKPTTTLTKKKQSTTIVTPNSATPSQFTNIKHKFGAHRKSMQVRVRKMCTRTDETNYNNCSGNNKQSYNGDEHFIPASSNGICIVAANVDGVAVKKSKSRWKSVKIRPKHFNSSSSYNSSNCSSTTSTNSTTDDISNATTTTTTARQRFFGSLPHLRKARISLFSTPNLHLTEKDQNSNLNEIGGKGTTTAEVTIVGGKTECNT